MRDLIIKNIFWAIIFIVPLVLKVLNYRVEFIDYIIRGIPAILIFLTVIYCFGLLCIHLLIPYSNFIKDDELLEFHKEKTEFEKTSAYKIYKTTFDILFFGLLILCGMRGTLILACLWWLTKLAFDISMDKFVKEL